VIGCGAISDEHLRYLAAADGVSLEAVCDTSNALAEITRDRFGAREAFTDVDHALATIRPDVVHVLTPPRTHADLVRRSIESGAHVICEKPLAPSGEQTRELLACAAQAGRALLETRNLLYNDIVRRLDRIVAAGAVGTIREIDASLTLELGNADVPVNGLGLPGGIVHDYLPHLAYLLLHFAPERSSADAVAGTVDNLSGRPEIGFDHVDALVSLGGVRCRVRVTPDVRPDSMRMIVRGTAGTLEADMYQPYLRHEGQPWVGKRAPFGLVADGARLIVAGGSNVRDRLLQHGTYHGMERMLAAIYDALRNATPMPITTADMLGSASLIDAIIELGTPRS
jgi:predicted dehydrogenase